MNVKDIVKVRSGKIEYKDLENLTGVIVAVDAKNDLHQVVFLDVENNKALPMEIKKEDLVLVTANVDCNGFQIKEFDQVELMRGNYVKQGINCGNVGVVTETIASIDKVLVDFTRVDRNLKTQGIEF